ncbi:MAG: hypothetical protein AAF800_04745 [Planctomycetota bacterium]
MPGLYEFSAQPDDQNALSESGSKIESVFTSFDTTTNQFVWEATYSAGPGDYVTGYGTAADTLPTGFALVINDGPMPKGHLGELAVIYFEAVDLIESGFTAGTPNLNVFAYNGGNSATSYRTSDDLDADAPPDPIVSSLAGFDFTASVVDDDSGPVLLRTMRIGFDATEILDHTPLQTPRDRYDDDAPLTWFGLGFAHQVGIWFHPFNDIDPRYNDDGFLADEGGVRGWGITRRNYGAFDVDMLDAVLVPEPIAAGLLLAVPLLGRRRRVARSG